MQITRSYGFFEKLLANIRAKIVKRLILKKHINGEKILDIGSGFYPLFLTKVGFQQKYSIEKSDIDFKIYKLYSIRHLSIDIETIEKFPFKDNYFDVVAMLAVFEHIVPYKIPKIFNEIYRILKPKGYLILTIPSGWTDKSLKFLSKIKLVSAVEIFDHKDVYNIKKVINIIKKTKFSNSDVEYGFFELYMNMWFFIKKNQ